MRNIALELEGDHPIALRDEGVVGRWRCRRRIAPIAATALLLVLLGYDLWDYGVGIHLHCTPSFHRRPNHMEYRNSQIEFSLPCPHCQVTGVYRFTAFITTVVARQLRDNPSTQHGPGEQIVPRGLSPIVKYTCLQDLVWPTFCLKTHCLWTFQLPAMGERNLITGRKGLSPLLAPSLRAYPSCVWFRKRD